MAKELNKLKLKESNIPECKKPYLILKHTHESCNALLTAFEIARVIRGIQKKREGEELKKLRGMSTDEEQDLLRAMLVTAASGLDSMTKQLIREALPSLIKRQSKALEKLEEFVQKSIKGEIDDEDFKGSHFLANILVAPSIKDQLIENYIKYLTKGSLQSVPELRKVMEALSISYNDIIKSDNKELKEIFNIRNKIIHELDINLDSINRNRNLRSAASMKNYTNTLIEVAENILKAVEDKLKRRRIRRK